jgi:hypothetical protein
VRRRPESRQLHNQTKILRHLHNLLPLFGRTNLRLRIGTYLRHRSRLRRRPASCGAHLAHFVGVEEGVAIGMPRVRHADDHSWRHENRQSIQAAGSPRPRVAAEVVQGLLQRVPWPLTLHHDAGTAAIAARLGGSGRSERCPCDRLRWPFFSCSFLEILSDPNGRWSAWRSRIM